MSELVGAVVESSALGTLSYPGRIVKRNEKGKALVEALQTRLNEVGCGPIDVDGAFGDQTNGAVRLFQARHTDADGQPLKIDGEVGPLTWARLFGTQTIPQITTAAGDLGKAVIEIAKTQLHVRERPAGSNRGPEVDEYIELTGLTPSGGHAWCVCFIFFCFDRAARQLGRSNPMIRTAGVLDLWNKAGQKSVPRVTQLKARNNPSLIQPGQIFVIDTDAPGGGGHAGLVEGVVGGKLVTIEGNTNDNGSREGIGVFRRTQRKVTSINKGFVDFTT